MQTLLEQFSLVRAEIESNGERTVSEIKDYMKVVDDKILSIDKRLKTQERELRRRNIIIFGIQEHHDLQPEELEELIIEIIRVKLGVDISISDIDIIRRIGKPAENKNRPVLLGLISLNLKLKILRNTYKLKGSDLFFAQDYSKEVLAVRKSLYPKMLEARKAGKFATLVHDKLIIKDRPTPDRKKRPLSVSPPEKTETGKDGAIINKRNKTDSSDKIKRILRQYEFGSSVTKATMQEQNNGQQEQCSSQPRKL